MPSIIQLIFKLVNLSVSCEIKCIHLYSSSNIENVDFTAINGPGNYVNNIFLISVFIKYPINLTLK